MNCDEARALIDQGVTPGSTKPQRAALGFHLAGCVDCRAYYAARDEHLLNTLLGQTNVVPVAAVAAPVEIAAPASAFLPRLTSRTGRYIGLALLVLLLCIGIVTGRSVYALYTIGRNVQAMQLATPRPASNAPRPSRVPTVAVPSSVARAPAGVIHPVATPTVVHRTPSSIPKPTSAVVAAAVAAPAVARTETATPELLPVPALASGPAVAPRGTPVSVPVPASGQAINILLLGIDRRPDEQGGSRSDAIMVAHLDPDRKRVALLSLPRDLIVDIPGYGYGRINAASVYGELYPELGGGLSLTRNTVSNVLGIPINYVMRIDFNGFTGAIDALGGVDINVEKELYDPTYPTMDYGYMEAHFLPGPQHMDGQTALIYARIRHMDSDFDRMHRQQSVVMAVGQQLKQQNTLQRLQSVASLTTAMRGYIETDLPEAKMAGLVWAFRNVSPTSVERYALDGDQVQMGVTADDPYAEYPLPGAIESLVQQLVNGPSQP